MNQLLWVIMIMMDLSYLSISVYLLHIHNNFPEQHNHYFRLFVLDFRNVVGHYQTYGMKKFEINQQASRLLYVRVYRKGSQWKWTLNKYMRTANRISNLHFIPVASSILFVRPTRKINAFLLLNITWNCSCWNLRENEQRGRS